MMIDSEALSGGFTHPVFQSQSAFRMLMDGMARPGTIQTVATDVGQPEPLRTAAGAIALTLCDHETPVWLSAGLGKSVVGEWIGFHTGAPLTREKAEARFAFLEPGITPASFGLFALGSQEYPDRSTTLVLEVAALRLEAGSGQKLTLSGPGILQSREIWIDGLPDSFSRLWIDNRALFPRGVDVILTAGRDLLCLPRTTKIAA
ncbi:phosphonate C-P lyase system protein PhnH [Neorhizobium lilium]|uniref:Phosphonate C-P lyase system protein PhnH n=1 Tax=Neorhizobium lilium TaxID=2503024 RepID=A0A444LGJ9_9HYPH|nr:phosphonate C-P lyase system protein PhnH [Neorhizobium lilium]RWX77309.1 phosphonate C-P lyase system protein PhnH [Neorhizobium lilium]